MIFLAKNGKITGPFTVEQFEQFKHSGELDRFAWFWDARASNWKPIDPPPAHAPAYDSVETRLADRAVNGTASPRPAPLAETAYAPTFKSNAARTARVEVILHDFRSVASAKIRHINELGCEVVVRASGHGVPFSERASVMLNLYDPKSEETMDIAASVYGLSHETDGLVYRIRWSDAPEMLASA